MKHFVLVLVCLLIAVSCQKFQEDNQEVLVQNLENSYKDWWLYFNDFIRLSSDFKAFDAESKRINKGIFLKSLATGKFIPLKLSSDTSETAYKLHQLGKDADENIVSTIKNMAEVELTNFQREGKKMQPFNFKDLNGKQYTSENTLGKTVVLKCWFIRCKKCIEEMPELNKMVKQFENRNDVVFISLAFDSETDLKKFLSKRDFDYAVVANQEDYLKNTLGISIFPTHFIINKKGVITKVANEMEIVREVLEKEI
ncbi:TlpA disulfide reductase family protein [Flavobacterium enshiense]|uniref:TlpA family protein disulfide reductase n=1 Tax=Flavobacterium enshiense TaxID=1341165 RepID=UPI00345D573F